MFNVRLITLLMRLMQELNSAIAEKTATESVVEAHIQSSSAEPQFSCGGAVLKEVSHWASQLQPKASKKSCVCAVICLLRDINRYRRYFQYKLRLRLGGKSLEVVSFVTTKPMSSFMF